VFLGSEVCPFFFNIRRHQQRNWILYFHNVLVFLRLVLLMKKKFDKNKTKIKRQIIDKLTSLAWRLLEVHFLSIFQAQNSRAYYMLSYMRVNVRCMEYYCFRIQTSGIDKRIPLLKNTLNSPHYFEHISSRYCISNITIRKVKIRVRS
jgi:hypothetical protein